MSLPNVNYQRHFLLFQLVKINRINRFIHIYNISVVLLKMIWFDQLQNLLVFLEKF